MLVPNRIFISRIFSLCLLLVQSGFIAEAYDFLGIFSMKAKSHWVVFSSLTTELARRGHYVEVYTIFPSHHFTPNYREFDMSSCFQRDHHFHDIDMKLMLEVNLIKEFQMVYDLLPRSFEIRNCPPIMKLVNSTRNFDALIVDPFDTEFYSFFAHKFNATLINIFPNILIKALSDKMGSPSNPSYIRDLVTESPTNFAKKLFNVYVYVLRTIYDRVFALPLTEKVCEEIFGSGGPSVEEILRNTSLVLTNSHFSVTAPVPVAPGIIEVAGIQIKNATKLPENIEKFINESEHGVVYFCMGSLLRGETFPEEKRNAFLYAFSKIPQRVLWKWEGDVLPGKSDNIMISKWMPQRDILAHPNVKLFISHGGLLGTSEAVYEGVPVLGIPIFGDQRTNIKSLEANGAGELLDYNEISKEVVLEKIQRLLNDPKYKENAKQLSARYRDRPMSPLDTAVYWTEYVIRHKGAPHLRTAAADMPWYQYLLLDVIAFLIVIFVSALAIIYYSVKLTFRFLCNLICGKKSSSKPVKKVKRN